MSAGAVYRHVLSRVMRLGLGDNARRDVTAALEAARKDSLLTLLYEAAHEAGVRDDLLLCRAGGAFCAFAAGNLADDLVDGDCSYLDPAVRLAPTVQWLLQNLAYALLLEGGVDGEPLRRTAELMAQAAGPQQDEVRETRWTARRYVDVGEGILGRQWQAYLVALWAGTPLAGEAEAFGMALGFAGHVALDVRSRDARFSSMGPAEQERVLERARASLSVLERSERRIAALTAQGVRPALRRAAVAAYYDDKTTRILDRYGPGPRVHYHTGVFDSPGLEALRLLSRDALRARMKAAQEALLHDALEAWGLTGELVGKRVLDAGCGLGGTSLLLAAAGARVTALTICAPHVAVVSDLALQAGVSERVEARCGAAEELADRRAWDAVFAVESSCYFDRERFFHAMRRALKPGGNIHIVDLFAGRPEVKAGFDRVWKTDVGTLAGYDAAARKAGFARTATTDVSARCAGFWDLTRADSLRQLAGAPTAAERERLEASLRAHGDLQARARDGGLLHLRVSYERLARGRA